MGQRQMDFSYKQAVAVGDVIDTEDGLEPVVTVISDTRVMTVPANGKGTPIESKRPKGGWRVVSNRPA